MILSWSSTSVVGEYRFKITKQIQVVILLC